MVREWFYGSVYNGSIVVDNTNSPSSVAWRLNNVPYTVMDAQSSMMCDFGFQGIFGVAFGGLNAACSLPSTMTAADLLFAPSACASGSTRYAICNNQQSGVTRVSDPTPIMSALAANDEQRFGLYTDISRLSTLSSFSGVSDVSSKGQTVYNKGKLYIGAAATSNEYYQANTPVTALTWPRLNPGSSTSTEYFWSFQLTGYTVVGTTIKKLL